MTLVKVLRPVVTALEEDIRGHSGANDEIHAHLLTEHQRAKDASRTALEFKAWRDEQVTLSAVQWVLACVFIRFCEDTGLIAESRLAGEGDRLAYAVDTTTHYFQENPTHSDREYLLWVFAETRKLPGMKDLFDPEHNPLYQLLPSVDGADKLLEFWRKLDTSTGDLALSFADETRDTRFLGDLYQDLSESARKRYALLQTPDFIESFILDRTLEPAIVEFGLADTDLIDPACGSGHFLLGAFDRLLGHWKEREPETSARALCQRTLDQIAGVDLNPFAVAIAEFRLLVAALNASEVEELGEAPDFRFNLANGDSLLHGYQLGQLDIGPIDVKEEFSHLYDSEDRESLTRILDRRYAAVVANPPYITPKDPAARDAYRKVYTSCTGKYALSVPFMERIFELAKRSDGRSPAGFTGQITSDSFMKRGFGRKLIEDFLPTLDLTHAIDTSYADIPGHTTPTVIILGRAQSPVSEFVRGVLGIRSGTSAPIDPAHGQVWSEITQLVDHPVSDGDFVSVEDLDREGLARHPWSLRGGGATKVKAIVEGTGCRLEDWIESSGFGGISGMDEITSAPEDWFRRSRGQRMMKPIVAGDEVREWTVNAHSMTYFPYDDANLMTLEGTSFLPTLWPFRAVLEARATFSGGTYRSDGRPWWEWHQLSMDRLKAGRLIPFAFVSTHNHFVLNRGGSVFKQSAPVIKLIDSASDGDHFALIAALNSSVAGFWGRQVFYPKGVASPEFWENRLEWDSTKLKKFPLPKRPSAELAQRLDALAQELAARLPASLLEENDPSRDLLDDANEKWCSLRRQMIALQEELDWRCYCLYGLINDDLVFPNWDALPEVKLGERTFEIALARRVVSGETETRWFERHGSTPITEIPEHFPAGYRELLQRRLDAIEENKSIRLIERPEYKRRWQTDSWEEMTADALRNWVCDRLESEEIWSEPKLLRADQIADELLRDETFQEALVLFGGTDVDPGKLIAKLLAEESVPYLSSLRYKPSGLRKRESWEKTWDLQRAEDRGEKVEIDVPPKYKSADFLKATYWKQRGKLDVPKERFTSYPGCASDGSELYSWAGFEHSQRAQALATRITQAQDQEGKSESVIIRMLAGLEELLPWVYQWHPDTDPTYGQPLGDIYDTFLDERTQQLGISRGELGILIEAAQAPAG